MGYVPEMKPYKLVYMGPHHILSSVPPGSSITYNYMPDVDPFTGNEPKPLSPVQKSGMPDPSYEEGQDGTEPDSTKR
ncbi:MAG: hypothetical protein LBR80_15480 [Deltaproteobacteria bacterium]|jgi:hypothetical protein|nr:hypothetical protein [Deltaproteobacteria bacterium]